MKRFLIILILLVTCFIIMAQSRDALRVKDSNDVDLGRLVDGNFNMYFLIITDSNYIFKIDGLSGDVLLSTVLFDEDDCSGTPYVDAVHALTYVPLSHEKYVFYDGNNYYIKKNDSTDDVLIESYTSDSNCVDDYFLKTVVELELVPTVYSDILEAIVPPLFVY